LTGVTAINDQLEILLDGLDDAPEESSTPLTFSLKMDTECNLQAAIVYLEYTYKDKSLIGYCMSLCLQSEKNA
jgi:hypothetical protein